MGETSSTHDIKANDAQFQLVIGNVLKTLQGLKSQIDQLGHAAKEMLVVGIAGFSIANFIKGAEEMEESLMRLHHAMEANGADMEVWGEKIDELAEHLARLSTHSAEAVRSFMGTALNRGVVIQDLEGMTKAAMGLSRATGMGLNVSLRQLMMAQEGSFGALQRFIPALKHAHSESEKLAIVNHMIAVGWKQEGEAINSTLGMQHKLHESLTELKEDLGQALLPEIKAFYTNARAVVLVMREWVAANKEIVGTVVKWTANILMAAVALPVIVKMFQFMGATMLWLVTNPIGLLITGFTALMVSMALMATDGELSIARLIEGFKRVESFLNSMLGSWENFKNGAVAIWDVIAAKFKQAWEGAYHFLAQTISLQAWFTDMWNNTGKAMAVEIEYGMKVAALKARAAIQMKIAVTDTAKLGVQGILFENMKRVENEGTAALADIRYEKRERDRRGDHPEEAARKQAQSAEDSRHKQASGRAEMDAGKAESTLRNLMQQGFKDPSTLMGNADNLLKTVMPEATRKKIQAAKDALMNALAGGGMGEPGQIGLNHPKEYKPKFESPDAVWHNMAALFAGGGGHDPNQKTADNTARGNAIQNKVLERTTDLYNIIRDALVTAVKDVKKAVENKVNPPAPAMGQ